MEKKGSRLLMQQPNGKALTTDSKKIQDGVGGKLWPRSGRRREPTNGASSTKGETLRKPCAPQRNNKSFDKRPRSRGTINSNVGMVRTETARLNDGQEAELGSVFVPGSKKQSLNHLLNFQYVPYVPETRQYNHQVGRGAAAKSNSWIYTRKHAFNKEHFIQANCQFIVNALGNYKQYMDNPDSLVDWSLIEQVNVQVTELSNCPICLYPPVAAKMTKCGHIYCWSCLLHYLALCDKSSRQCPICFEYVDKQDLKSVVSIPHSVYNVNDIITFKLMKRPKGSLIAYPSTTQIKDDDTFLNLSEKICGEVYSKLLLANHTEIMSIITRENDELIGQLLEDEQCPENCFILEALKLLEQRRELINNEYNCKTDKMEIVNDLAVALENVNLIQDEEKNFQQANDEKNFTDLSSNTNPQCLDISNNVNGPQLKFHYFYQASDGQHIYLHALNARMLEHTYGSLEFGPKTLSGRILEKEGGSMSLDLRKRLRYLQHLPITCQFEVAEIQMKEPIVTRDTLQHFNEQIETRRKRRQRRAKDEKRREKRIADEENRLLGKYPTPNLHLESQLQFPGFEARPRTESESTHPSEANSFDSATTPSSSLGIELEYPGPSFAKMLTSSAKKPQSQWPSLKASTSSVENTTPVKLINVTGSKMKCTSFVVRQHSDSEQEMDNYETAVPPPANSNLADVIAKALEKSREHDTEDDTDSKKKKKKKKPKQKLLFVNSMAYLGK